MSFNHMKYMIIIVTLLLAGATRAETGEVPVYDRISLSSSVTAEVENDRMVAVLFAMAEGRDAEALADRVNTDVQWAVNTARSMNRIKVTTVGYRSTPVYRDNRIAAWRVRQSIRLVASDPARLGKLLGVLQERLSIGSLGNEVTVERLDRVRDQLTRDALAAFRARAELIARELGVAGYRIVTLQVGDIDAPPLMRPAIMQMRAEVAAPAIEPGTRNVRIQVSGVIELMRP